MTVSASRNDHHDDVLQSGEVRAARRWPSRPLVVAAGTAMVLAVALAAQVLGDPDAGGESEATTVDLRGSLSLSNFRSESFGAERGWGDSQERNAIGSGTVLLQLPDRQVEGTAQIAFEASYKGDDANGYFHSWGGIRLQLGSPTVECRGSFGWSNFKAPPEGGGSMHARCDDGALLAAEMVETQQMPGQTTLTIDLRDGWYVADSANADAPEPQPGTLPQSGY